MQIIKQTIDLVAALGKMQVDRSSMPLENKMRAKDYIDLSKEAIKLLNDWITQQSQNNYLNSMSFCARKYGVKKVVVFPSLGGMPLFKIYGEKVQEFAKEMNIGLMDAMLSEDVKREIYSIPDEYGTVIYPR